MGEEILAGPVDDLIFLKICDIIVLMDTFDELPGEEWSGEIPEPASDEIPTPPVPDDTPATPEIVVVETKVTYQAPTPAPTPVYYAPVYSAPAETAAEAPAETPKETPADTKAEAPAEANSDSEAFEPYIEVPTTAAPHSLYLDKDTKITLASLTATGIVVFTAIAIVALTKIKKLPQIKAQAKSKIKTKAKTKVNPLM